MAIPRVNDPIVLFHEWLEEATHCGLREPTAACLATADASGAPSARMVLVKSVDQRGFVFYTNLGSRKARELEANPRASLCFYWMPVGKQVRVNGTTTPVAKDEADSYFATRDKTTQIGAWASRQSQPISGILELERCVAEYTLKYGLAKVPRPSFWSGYRLAPMEIEFWLEKPFRLHERLLYSWSDTGWAAQWLFP
jgi:pyridoxamine 5'-phosphate oxidase